MSDVLDLSSIKPNSLSVKLADGKEYELKPLKVKQVIDIYKAFNNIKDDKKGFEELSSFVSEIMPAFRQSKIDLTFQEMEAILMFVMEKTAGEVKSGQKKTLKSHSRG